VWQSEAVVGAGEEAMAIVPGDHAHVYWIGGSPCSGKRSIAEALAATYGFQRYQTDNAYVRHAMIVRAKRQPGFHKLTRLADDALWMRALEEQVVEEVARYHAEFPLILDHLLA
jgi:hypothetical protein